MLRLFVAATFVLGATPAIAQGQLNQDTAALQGKEANRVICRSIEEIGSRLARKRVCLTSQQWKEQERLQSEAVSEQQQKASIQ